MQLLFVCSKNRWRSLTAEKIFQGCDGHDVKSVGTERNARIRVEAGHVGWADIIFVMEKKHMRRLKDKFGLLMNGKQVHCLHIPDDFKYMDGELVEILISRVSEYIKIPFNMEEV